MLKLRNNIFENITATPKEHYTFHFDAEDLDLFDKKYMDGMKKRFIIHLALILLLFVYGIFLFEGFAWCAVGTLIVVPLYIKAVSMIKKENLKRKEQYPNALFDYTLYDGFLVVWISSNDSVRQRRVYLYEIKKARIVGNLVALEIDHQLYLMKKDELMENSYFLSICTKK